MNDKFAGLVLLVFVALIGNAGYASETHVTCKVSATSTCQ